MTDNPGACFLIPEVQAERPWRDEPMDGRVGHE